MNSAMEEFMSLVQEGTVNDYCEAFETLLSKIKIPEDFSEDYVVYLFITGLKPGISEVLKPHHNNGRSLKLKNAFFRAEMQEMILKLDSIEWNQHKTTNTGAATMDTNQSYEIGISDSDESEDINVDEISSANSRFDDSSETIEVNNSILQRKDSRMVILGIENDDNVTKSDNENDDINDHVHIDHFNDTIEYDLHKSDTFGGNKSFRTDMWNQEIRKKKLVSLLFPDTTVINLVKRKFKSNIVYERVKLSLFFGHHVKVGNYVKVLGSTLVFGPWNKEKQIKWEDTGWVSNLECRGILIMEIVIQLTNENKVWEVGLVAIKPITHLSLGANDGVELYQKVLESWNGFKTSTHHYLVLNFELTSTSLSMLEQSLSREVIAGHEAYDLFIAIAEFICEFIPNLWLDKIMVWVLGSLFLLSSAKVPIPDARAVIVRGFSGHYHSVTQGAIQEANYKVTPCSLRKVQLNIGILGETIRNQNDVKISISGCRVIYHCLKYTSFYFDEFLEGVMGYVIKDLHLWTISIQHPWLMNGTFMLHGEKEQFMGSYFLCGLLRTKVFDGERLSIRGGDVVGHVMVTIIGCYGTWLSQHSDNSTKDFDPLTAKHEVEQGFGGQDFSFVSDTFD
ncbi:uncharacterized protein LOC118488442 [Helianthus annuus]|uniref:uncharacterized protein LOC118488442 n=1 Tax=Helianthus annuus TaxID=4232 RepID=UPI0016533E40|nr:uncharacterized protein LOC118488442 [Helianthus annuus]